MRTEVVVVVVVDWIWLDFCGILTRWIKQRLSKTFWLRSVHSVLSYFSINSFTDCGSTNSTRHALLRTVSFDPWTSQNKVITKRLWMSFHSNAKVLSNQSIIVWRVEFETNLLILLQSEDNEIFWIYFFRWNQKRRREGLPLYIIL